MPPVLRTAGVDRERERERSRMAVLAAYSFIASVMAIRIIRCHITQPAVLSRTHSCCGAAHVGHVYLNKRRICIGMCERERVCLLCAHFNPFR